MASEPTDNVRDMEFEAKERERRQYPISSSAKSLVMQTKLAWAAIKAWDQNPRTIFQMRGKLVRLSINKEHGRLEPHRITVDELTGISAQSAYWYTGKDGERSEAYPPERAVKVMLADPAPPVDYLRRIVPAPVFHGTGFVVEDPGYDEIAEVYFDKDPDLKIAPVRIGMIEQEDVDAARKLIVDEFLGSFPFADDSSKAHAIALLLDPFIRGMCTTPSPMFVIDAPAHGTGKTLLAELITGVFLGRQVMKTTLPKDEKVMNTLLLSILMSSPEAVLFDNVSSKVDFSSLAAATTTDESSDRPLYTNDIATVKVHLTWIITATNLITHSEIARRYLRIRLDANSENPHLREFKRDIRKWAKQHRSRLIDACLVLIANWIDRGMQPGKQSIGSYEHWCKVVGGILRDAGIEGFLADLEKQRNVGIEHEAMSILFNDWWAQYETEEVGTKEIYPIADEIDGIPLGNGTERSRKTKLGSMLNDMDGMVRSGKKLHLAGTKKRAQQFWLSDVNDPDGEKRGPKRVQQEVQFGLELDGDHDQEIDPWAN